MRLDGCVGGKEERLKERAELSGEGGVAGRVCGGKEGECGVVRKGVWWCGRRGSVMPCSGEWRKG